MPKIVRTMYKYANVFSNIKQLNWIPRPLPQTNTQSFIYSKIITWLHPENKGIHFSVDWRFPKELILPSSCNNCVNMFGCVFVLLIFSCTVWRWQKQQRIIARWCSCSLLRSTMFIDLWNDYLTTDRLFMQLLCQNSYIIAW